MDATSSMFVCMSSERDEREEEEDVRSLFDLLNNNDLCVWCRWFSCALCGSLLFLFFQCTITDVFMLENMWIIDCSLQLSFFLIFQLVKKPTHQVNARPVPTYEDDEYETGGSSTVWRNA